MILQRLNTHIINLYYRWGIWENFNIFTALNYSFQDKYIENNIQVSPPYNLNTQTLFLGKQMFLADVGIENFLAFIRSSIMVNGRFIRTEYKNSFGEIGEVGEINDLVNNFLDYDFTLRSGFNFF